MLRSKLNDEELGPVMADLFPFVIGNPKRFKIKRPGVGLVTFFCVGASDVFDSAGELGRARRSTQAACRDVGRLRVRFAHIPSSDDTPCGELFENNLGPGWHFTRIDVDLIRRMPQRLVLS